MTDQASRYPLLDGVTYPSDLRRLRPEQLPQLAEELRDFMLRAVAKTGGHLGAGLGVVELTVALHYVFDTPDDRLIWDVGHQAYPHKILTGRKDRMETLRKEGGLSGFTKRDESEYDPFGAGHSSTSISAGCGMTAAHALQGLPRHTVAVIGDGALSAGMAFEALNNAGALRHGQEPEEDEAAGSRGSRLTVILNDNKMSIAPAVGAMSRYLNRAFSSAGYRKMRRSLGAAADLFPERLRHIAEKTERYTREALTGGGNNLFEELGFYYVGPLDGHHLPDLVALLRNVRASAEAGGRPAFVHVRTEKGRGCSMRDSKNEKLHAVPAFDPETGETRGPAESGPSWTKVFSDTLVKLGERDERVVAVTAAMPSGTGVDAFVARFPSRCFDVGIAEQHAATFCAGLAAEGMKPFCAIYSTFLQRAYDQVVHDVALQKLPVRFMIDRAGPVGADGATHAGVYDNSFLGCLPGMVLAAPSDAADLQALMALALVCDDRPFALRYPRGAAHGEVLADLPPPPSLGLGRIIRQGEGHAAILSYGDLLPQALEAADLLEAETGRRVTVADARFLKPLDTDLVRRLVEGHALTATLESNVAGGFGSAVLHYAALHLPAGCAGRILPLTLPDEAMEHASVPRMLSKARLDGPGISARMSARLRAA